MPTTKLNRLRCTECSETYKEAKLLDRHQREKHSQKQGWSCDHPGCSIDFQCPRFKTEHMKKQHANQIARSLSPDEQSGHGFQSDINRSVGLDQARPGGIYVFELSYTTETSQRCSSMEPKRGRSRIAPHETTGPKEFFSCQKHIHISQCHR
jgi:hypothetical protein